MAHAIDKPERLCGRHGLLHDDQGCPECRRATWVNADAGRGPSNARGYDSAWEKVRDLALQRDNYLCQDCLLQGHYETATEVDHVIPIDQRYDLRLSIDNLRSLCHPHHVKKTHKDKRHGPTPQTG